MEAATARAPAPVANSKTVAISVIYVVGSDPEDGADGPDSSPLASLPRHYVFTTWARRDDDARNVSPKP